MRVSSSADVASSPDEAFAAAIAHDHIVGALRAAWPLDRYELVPLDRETHSWRARVMGRDDARGGLDVTILLVVAPSGAGSRIEVDADLRARGDLAEAGRDALEAAQVAFVQRLAELPVTPSRYDRHARVRGNVLPFAAGLAIGVTAYGLWRRWRGNTRSRNHP